MLTASVPGRYRDWWEKKKKKKEFIRLPYWGLFSVGFSIGFLCLPWAFLYADANTLPPFHSLYFSFSVWMNSLCILSPTRHTIANGQLPPSSRDASNSLVEHCNICSSGHIQAIPSTDLPWEAYYQVNHMVSSIICENLHWSNIYKYCFAVFPMDRACVTQMESV